MTLRVQRFARPWLVATLFVVIVLSAATSSFASPAREQPKRLRAGDKTGDIVVVYEAGKVASVKRAVRAGGATIERTYAKSGIVVASAAGTDTAALVRDLERVPGVRFAEESRVIQASFVPNDPGYRDVPNSPDQWNLRRIGSEAAWDVERGDPSVVVAVVDTGVDLQHPDLVGRLDSVNDTDVITGRGHGDDVYGHGTHVAGIIAANANNALHVAGLAHGCTILPVRALDDNGYGDTTYMGLGVIWAADHGADVINISAGGPLGAQFLEHAIAYAVSRDCVVVAASGNDGVSRLNYPAAYPGVISVGAVDQNAQRWSRSNYSAGLDLMAPGVTYWSSVDPASATGILSLITGSEEYANGGMGTMYGTSMAAPHVAAVAALLRSANSTWSATAVGNRMIDTAEDISTAGWDLKTGYGLVRADRALGVDAPPTEDMLDNRLPGLPLSTSPVAGIVDIAFDEADIYSRSFLEGQRVTASLRGTTGSLMRLEVFGPNETTLTAVPLLTAISTGLPAGLEFTVAPGEAGTYSFRVIAEQGGGPYQLTWFGGYDTETTITAPVSCSWGGSAIVRGTVRGYQDQGVSSARVVLDAWPAGASGWTLGVAQASTDSSGSYYFKTYPKRRTNYRVRFEGSSGHYASTSAIVNIWPRASLSRPVPTTTVRRQTPFRVTGFLKPRHPAGKRPVRIRAYHLESGVWVLGRTVYAVSSNWSSYTRYTGSLTLRSRGRWKLVADVRGDSVHRETSSSATYVYVR